MSYAAYGSWQEYVFNQAEALRAVQSDFSRAVLKAGSLEPSPHLGPTCVSSSPVELGEMDIYVCGILAEWYGRYPDRKLSSAKGGRSVSDKKRRGKHSRAHQRATKS